MCYQKSNLLYPFDKLGPLTGHHRRPRSHGGKRNEENLSYVPNKLHEAYHLLFSNNSVNRIADILNEHWIDPDYVMVPVPKEFLESIFNKLQKSKDEKSKVSTPEKNK